MPKMELESFNKCKQSTHLHHSKTEDELRTTSVNYKCTHEIPFLSSFENFEELLKP